MNPPRFTGSSTIEDPGNLIEELKKVFEVMHISDTEHVELDVYQMQMFLGLGSTSGRSIDLRMHHLQVSLILRRLSWGIYFLEN